MIKVLTTAPELRAIESEWDELAAADPSATPYQTAALTLGLWSLLAPNVHPLVVVARDDDGKLAAILPLGIHRRRVGPIPLRVLGPLALWHGSYFDAIVSPRCDPRTTTAMLSAARDHDDAWDGIMLPHLRLESHIRGALGSAGLTPHAEGVRHAVRLTPAGAATVGRFGKNIRRTWRRLLERFRTRGMKWRIPANRYCGGRRWWLPCMASDGPVPRPE